MLDPPRGAELSAISPLGGLPFYCCFEAPLLGGFSDPTFGCHDVGSRAAGGLLACRQGDGMLEKFDLGVFG